MGFTKLDEGILTSSVMGEAGDIFKVWIAFLAAVKQDGIARVTVIYLSGVCHLPIETIEAAIARLEAPDPYSRTKEREGRRIIPVEDGWFVVNYEKYRSFSYSESPEAIRARRYRDKKKKRDASRSVTTPSRHSASVLSSSENKRKGVDASFDSWWSRYPRKVEKKVASKAYLQAVKNGASPEDLAKALEGYRAEIDRLRTEERYIKYASTFLHEDRWRDYLPKPKLTPEEFRRQHEADLQRVRG